MDVQAERKLKKVVILDYKDVNDITVDEMFQLLEQISSFLVSETILIYQRLMPSFNRSKPSRFDSVVVHPDLGVEV